MGLKYEECTSSLTCASPSIQLTWCSIPRRSFALDIWVSDIFNMNLVDIIFHTKLAMMDPIPMALKILLPSQCTLREAITSYNLNAFGQFRFMIHLHDALYMYSIMHQKCIIIVVLCILCILLLFFSLLSNKNTQCGPVCYNKNTICAMVRK